MLARLDVVRANQARTRVRVASVDAPVEMLPLEGRRQDVLCKIVRVAPDQPLGQPADPAKILEEFLLGDGSYVVHGTRVSTEPNL